MYSGDVLKKDEKSMSFHINYQADRNLTNEEVDKIQLKLIQKIQTRFEATVRV